MPLDRFQQDRDQRSQPLTAYVQPEWQGLGVGSRLLKHLSRGAERPMLVGTWAAAYWAIRFYERHGFSLVARSDTALILRAYWHVPERQVATSVVLMSPLVTDLSALIAGSHRTWAATGDEPISFTGKVPRSPE